MNSNQALQAILAKLDYTRAACRLQDTIGSLLSPQMIADARMAIERERGDKDTAAPDPNVLIVPVTEGFDPGKPIGMLRIDKRALPTVPNFVFSIGFMPLTNPSGPFELKEIALVSDASYIGYLRQVGILPAAEPPTPPPAAPV